MDEAAGAARLIGRPWVLDPVAVGATVYRRATGARLLERLPSVVRGNASEIIALEARGAGGRGVDSSDPAEAAELAGKRLAHRVGGVVAVTGEVDLLTDGRRLARVRGGHPLMPRVITLGCALTGVVAAFLASADDPFEATGAALACYGAAGQQAGRSARGPVSIAVAFLDALHALEADALDTLPLLELHMAHCALHLHRHRPPTVRRAPPGGDRGGRRARWRHRGAAARQARLRRRHYRPGAPSVGSPSRQPRAADHQ